MFDRIVQETIFHRDGILIRVRNSNLKTVMNSRLLMLVALHLLTQLAPTTSKSLTDALRYIKNSVTMCERVHRLIKTTTEKIKELILNPDYKGN